MNLFFHGFATFAAKIVGKSWSFIIAVFLIIGWAVVGVVFHFSDSWQLFINTATTIITFLMVFLIQHTQNRDAESTQLKLDELIRIHKGAHNSIIDLDKLSDKQLETLEAEYKKLSDCKQKNKKKI